MPYYDYEQFKQACESQQDNVIPWGSVKRDAKDIFKLYTEEELLNFIANGGLEELKFVNTKEWEKNPNKSNKIEVDAYEFKTLGIRGYIAFMFNKITQKWIIKSFHMSDQSNDTMKKAFKIAFKGNRED